MKKSRWADPTIPLEVLALKLCEEAAEVGTEITDLFTHEAQLPISPKEMQRNQVNALVRAEEELEHVEFIAQCLRMRIKDELDKLTQG